MNIFKVILGYFIKNMKIKTDIALASLYSNFEIFLEQNEL